jgi:two-component system, OmpR family, sensor kinase
VAAAHGSPAIGPSPEAGQPGGSKASNGGGTGTGAGTGLPAVRLSVSDNGQGIPPDLVPELFERFARGDSSRSRSAGSTGLGLAIVKAVVAAHHGTVSVESHPGQTTFTIVLPRLVESSGDQNDQPGAAGTWAPFISQ